ncbi:AAA family ATPase [Arcicella sp. DC2W]|uniref:AAA family ATPase n=1 Tax=Arcicella gelida TaxID=2984195 RepID=A0ABU5RZK4_9BACT|nr:AAA family ATPase [Arcicella sp. DC2W]MEA5401631.1 AAA family ATPase [Arcicella sp. DC2W]
MMEKITIHNYRCFELLSLNFKEGVNLFIGDNSSGKTTLIRALSTVLNSFFIGFSDENTRFLGLSPNDFSVVESTSGLANEPAIKIDFTNLRVNASLELNSKKGRTLQKPLDAINRVGKSLYKNLFEDKVQKETLPLFASFSTADIHTTRKINREKFKNYDQKPSFGYYECLQGDGFLDYWTKRLLILKEAQKGEIEIEGVRLAIQKALGVDGCNVIEDMQIRHNQGKVYYMLTDKREVETALLSDGLTRLVNIVLDLSFRCMLLNKGIFGVEACANTKGTVLIDEIDLHLHPSLQSLVVKGVQNAFPQLQFIITSHSPLLMSGILDNEKNVIYKLTYAKEKGYIAQEVKTYGLDASTIIETVLGVIPRTKEVDDRLNTLFSFIDIDDYISAANYLNQMKEEFGDSLPELSKAETMLNFLSDNDD